MMVKDEDLEVVGSDCELLFDPAISPAPDLAVVEVGLGRVDRDDRDPAASQDGTAGADQLLEVQVPDVSRVVVARHDDERLALDRVEIALRLRELFLESEGREVAGAHDDLGLQLVDLGNRALHQIGHEMRIAAVEV